MPHMRNCSRGEVAVQIRKVLLQVLQTHALGEVIREFVQVTHPVLPILPIRETDIVHALPACEIQVRKQGRLFRACPDNGQNGGLAASKPGNDGSVGINGHRMGENRPAANRVAAFLDLPTARQISRDGYSSAMHLTEIPRLQSATPTEKIALIDELWASIPPESVATPASHLAELAKRIASLEQAPDKALPPDEARARIRARTGL